MGLTDERVARALAAIDLELKGSGQFVLVDGGVPFEGGWTWKGDQIGLTIEKYLNQPMVQQTPDVQKMIDFTIRVEGHILFFKSKADSEEIELTPKKSEETLSKP